MNNQNELKPGDRVRLTDFSEFVTPSFMADFEFLFPGGFPVVSEHCNDDRVLILGDPIEWDLRMFTYEKIETDDQPNNQPA